MRHNLHYVGMSNAKMRDDGVPKYPKYFMNFLSITLNYKPGAQ